MNKKIINIIIKKLILFFITTGLLCVLLVSTAWIPKEAIRHNSLVSAQYLMQKDVFFDAASGINGSRIDRYADSILLNIAYHYDREYPLRSVMVSAYYFTPSQDENANFLDAVKDDLGVNRQYLRYWHGSILFVRPLLTVLSIRGIYILHAILLILLFSAFLVTALRLRQRAVALAMTLALIFTGIFFVPLSLEYTWNFLVMLAASLAALILASREKPVDFGTFFMITGMITCFLDFLTTETLTLLIPLLIILKVKKTPFKEAWKSSLYRAFCWGFGYAGIWAAKWGLTAIVYRENVIPYVAEHIGERLGGDLTGVSGLTMITRAVTRNIFCLFPLGYGGAGAVAAIVIILAGAYIAYVYHVNDFDRGSILLFALIGIVPFIRFLILHNHSYIHYFFTYRALGSTIFALVLIIACLTGEKGGPGSSPGKRR
ncbi:MAG: hypothetical protein K6F34_06225 [Lachnospiraceae bacterium]|nr:hypothetical protein [Lachnospiraceae bacterium]